MKVEKRVEGKKGELKKIVKDLVYNHIPNTDEFSERLIDFFVL